MSTDLKPGDRVRLTNKIRVPGFQAGDRGRILRGPKVVREIPYYLVEMAPPSQGATFLFARDEIEPDD
jgi:hypothetical protein